MVPRRSSACNLLWLVPLLTQTKATPSAVSFDAHCVCNARTDVLDFMRLAWCEIWYEGRCAPAYCARLATKSGIRAIVLALSTSGLHAVVERKGSRALVLVVRATSLNFHMTMRQTSTRTSMCVYEACM